MTTGRRLMAGRRWAPGELFGAREPAQGLRSLTPNHLNIVPHRNSPHVAKSRPADSPRPVVVGCSFNTFPHGEPVLTVPLNDDEELPDTEFPLGDGTAETAATVYCPYCNESVEIAIDPGGGAAQEYVEDCEVCCQPWSVSVQYREDGTAKVSIEPLDE